MQAAADFFALRPVFTYRGLLILWRLYLAAVVLDYVASLALIIRSPSGDVFLSLVPALLYSVALVVLVRLLIEVALRVLIAPAD